MRVILLALILCLFNPAHSQVNQQDKLEFDIQDGYHNLAVYPIADGTFILRMDKQVRGGREIQFSKYNSVFELINKVEVTVPSKYKYQEIFYNSSMLYCLVYHYKSGQYKIINYDLNTFELEINEGVLGRKFLVDNMELLGDNLFMEGTVKKKNSMLKCLNTQTQFIEEINLSKQKNEKLTLTNMHVQSNLLWLCLEGKIKYSNNSMHFVERINSSNDIVGQRLNIELTEDKVINNFYPSALTSDDLFVIGSYGLNSVYSNGIFIARYKDQEEQFLNYYSFSDFANYFNYLNKRKQKVIKKKAKRKKSKGKELKLRNRIVLHDIQEENGVFYVVGEIYFPTYRTQTYTTTGANGVTTTQTVTVFDGYQYSHATVLAIDGEGNKLWDQTFEMWLNNKPMFVKKFISFDVNHGLVSLLYANSNEIFSMKIQDGNIINSKDTVEAQVKESEKIKYMSSSVDHWFNDVFLSYGYQKIKDKEAVSKQKKRKVYFIRKLSYGSNQGVQNQNNNRVKKSKDIF